MKLFEVSLKYDVLPGKQVSRFLGLGWEGTLHGGLSWTSRSLSNIPNPTLLLLSTSPVPCFGWEGGNRWTGPEELILNAEVAPEDPGDLQGIKGEEGDALSWFFYRHSSATFPTEAGDGGIWTPRDPAALSP